VEREGGYQQEQWQLQLEYFPSKPAEMKALKHDRQLATLLDIPIAEYLVEVYLYNDTYRIDVQLKDKKDQKVSSTSTQHHAY
jgi:hypothetical protein